jgi:hypothetical protein
VRSVGLRRAACTGVSSHTSNSCRQLLSDGPSLLHRCRYCGCCCCLRCCFCLRCNYYRCNQCQHSFQFSIRLWPLAHTRSAQCTTEACQDRRRVIDLLRQSVTTPASRSYRPPIAKTTIRTLSQLVPLAAGALARLVAD